MEFTIRSRKHGPITFWMNGDEGYVSINRPGRPGQLGDQICDGGSYGGSTIRATSDNFEQVCRRWHKQRMAKIAAYNEDYLK